MRTAIMACVDAPPVLEFGEQVFDQVTLFVGRLVVTILHFALCTLRLAFGRIQGMVPRAVSAARNQSLS